MSYDKHLAERISLLFGQRTEIQEKKMFGGICFLVDGNMVCGVTKDKLMLRVGPEQYEACLTEEHTSHMDFTGKPLRGMIFVAKEGYDTDSSLEYWISKALSFATSLPKK